MAESDGAFVKALGANSGLPAALVAVRIGEYLEEIRIGPFDVSVHRL